MTQDPTPYDLLQDSRIEGVEELVHPYYQPPGDAEYSFPVVGQGINSDQYQQMSLAQGTGVIIRDRAQRPYQLVGHATEAETNQRNTLILKVSGRTGVNEAIINGFYHRMTEDIEIQLPPVTTPTTYYICLTYDPRREEEEQGPIRVETHQNDVPTTHGRVSIVLQTVRREPNQLLTQAVRQIHRPYISPTITAVSEDALPDPDSVMYGTVAVVRNGGDPGAADLLTAEGNRWYNLLAGEWEQITTLSTGWTHVTGRPAMIRRTALGYQMRGGLRNSGATNATQIGQLPEGFSVNPLFESPGFVFSTTTNLQVVELEGRNIRLRLSQHDYRTDRVTFDGVIIPYS